MILRALAPAPKGGVMLLVWMWGKAWPAILHCDANAQANWQMNLTDDATYAAYGLRSLANGEFLVTSQAVQAGYDHPCLDRRGPDGQRILRMFLPNSGPVFDAQVQDGDLLAVGRLADGSAATLTRATWWGQSGCLAAGLCAGQGAAHCDDGLPCTADACVPSGGCVHAKLAGCGL